MGADEVWTVEIGGLIGAIVDGFPVDMGVTDGAFPADGGGLI